MLHKFVFLISILFLFFNSLNLRADADPAVLERFKNYANNINHSDIDSLAIQNRGRIKPLNTFAREAVLFLTGKYSPHGIHPTSFYIALMTSDAAPFVEAINIRSPSLRETLGFSKKRKLFTLQELENSKIFPLAQPAMQRQDMGEKNLSQADNDLIETAQQVMLLRSIIRGEAFFSSLVLNPETASSPHGGNTEIAKIASSYLQAVAGENALEAKQKAAELKAAALSQPVPELFIPYLKKLDTEVLFNKLQLFFIAGILYFLLGILCVSGAISKFKLENKFFVLMMLPLLLHIIGFSMRVYITGFAPVTNMYGTMIWVGFGIVLFGTILNYWYRNFVVFGILLCGTGATLLLTESIPLILSPDLDPVVAVLRNNFWLTIHVLTITISYACFSIAMLLGNTAIIRTIFSQKSQVSDPFILELSKICYRAIQMGVLLLTAGIILGGWWADYSWGRFWGWDPKETWALIADLGFLIVLHARYAGWVNPFTLLALSPVAYLLVIMAWYGVNFILASGLHSYGFSSGGAVAVFTFVSLQLILIAQAIWVHRKSIKTWIQREEAAQ